VVIYYGGIIHAHGTLKDLLAKPDSLRITTPVLPRQTLERVLEIIRTETANGEVRVDNPTQNLESYFLGVVARARAATETSGAQSGAKVAEYLRGGMEAKPPAEKLLEKLALPQAAPAVVRPAAETTVARVDDRKLAALLQPTPPAPAPRPDQRAPDSAPPPPADLSKADEKLSSLLGGKQ
jgi:hypothetical protein